MTNREKQRDLFIELINEQLKEHGVTYNEVKENPMWYMEYKTTPEKEEVFINHCVNRIREVLKLSKPAAEKEASWFILQWGLTTTQTREKSSQSNSSQKTIKGSES
jgi:hypothetical protein